MQLLLDKGADINVEGEDGVTALFWVAGCRHEAIVLLLFGQECQRGDRG
jgi:ankyrin repeat protein